MTDSNRDVQYRGPKVPLAPSSADHADAQTADRHMRLSETEART